MTKENVLFSIIGVLLGFIVGFIFANSVNQSAFSTAPRNRVAATTVPGTNQPNINGNLPPDHPQLPMNAVRDQQALQTAIEETTKRAKEAPDNFEAQVKAADSLGQAGRYTEAIDYLLQANKLRPDNVEVVIQLGNANFELERYEAAERWYSAALVKKPDNVNVRTDLGLTFYFRKPNNVDRAIEEFRRSLQYDPQHELTLQNITVVLTDRGDVDEARATLARLEEVNPNNRVLPKLREDLAKARAASSAKK